MDGEKFAGSNGMWFLVVAKPKDSWFFGHRKRKGCFIDGFIEIFMIFYDDSTTIQYLPSGKRTNSYGKSLLFMGKSTISMAMFNSYVTIYQRVTIKPVYRLL